MKKTRNGGITLIALVITIIVLLILAGVSIAMLTGDNGILTQASNAKTQQEYSSVVEGMKLAVNEYITEKKTNEITLSFVDWLKEEEREYINDDNEIQVSNLLGQSLSTGKGSGTNDVYKLEEVTETAKLASTEKVASITTEENKKYEVVYYNNKAERISIDTIEVVTTEVLEETDPSLFEVNDGVISVKDVDTYYKGMNKWTIENVVIPSEVEGNKATEISWDLFFGPSDHNVDRGFKNIKSVVVPEGIVKIEDAKEAGGGNYVGAFGYCYGLEKVELPTTLEYIGNRTFYSCTSLTSVEMSGNLTKIGNEVFSGCAALKSIEMPDSVTSIGERAFLWCTSLKSITIPSSVTEMGYTVFGGWTSEQEIHVPFNRGEEPPSGWSEYWNEGCEATIVYADD